MKEKKITKEELLKKAKEPAKKAMKWHPFYKGKIEVSPKVQIKSFDDFGVWYTPGVAKPCEDIHKNPEMVYEHTNKWNNVAVVSDGSRVLGLGDRTRSRYACHGSKRTIVQISRWSRCLPHLFGCT